MKRLLMLFAISFVCTWMILKIVSPLFGQLSCTVSSQVCDFVIDPTHVCTNGVGSNSSLSYEDGNRAFIPTDKPCGMVWYVWWLLSYPTFETCGTSVSSDCL